MTPPFDLDETANKYCKENLLPCIYPPNEEGGGSYFDSFKSGYLAAVARLRSEEAEKRVENEGFDLDRFEWAKWLEEGNK